MLMDDFDIIEEDFTLVGETSSLSRAELGGKAFGLRDYQGEAKDCVEEGFLELQRILITLATGCGKTVIFVFLTKLWNSRGKRVLILAHTDSLIEQARDKLRNWGLESAKEKAEENADLHDMVVVASVQTLGQESRLAGWPEDHFDYIIIDEAHHTLAKRYRTIIDHFTKAKVLGVTATVDRGDKKSLSDVYERIAYDYGILQACKDGWLVRPVVQTVPLEIDLQGIKNIESIQGQEEVSHRLEPFINDIAASVVERAQNRKTLLFLPSVDLAIQMSDALNRNGMRSDYVSGYCKNPEDKLAAHRRGDVQALCNAMLLTEGYDDDSISVIVCLRPTQVRSLYVQIVGRGTRPHGSIVKELNAANTSEERCQILANSPKPNVLLLDFLWLYEKHDLCSPASLLSKDPRIQERMRGTEGDLLNAEEQANRDFLESLKKAVSKNKDRKAQLVDPLDMAEELGCIDFADYVPSTKWEAQAVPPKVAEQLAKHGVDPATVSCMGQADLIIKKIIERQKRGLCTIRQMLLFRRFEKEYDINPQLWSKQRASQEIVKLKSNKWKPHWRRRVTGPTATQGAFL